MDKNLKGTRKRVPMHDKFIHMLVKNLIGEHEYQKLIINGWSIVVVDQRRGKCNYTKRLITIPLFALLKSRGYVTYYVAHELAHAFSRIDGNPNGHNKQFYEWFSVICPEHLQHFELNYKPRNAKSAGIAA